MLEIQILENHIENHLSSILYTFNIGQNTDMSFVLTLAFRDGFCNAGETKNRFFQHTVQLSIYIVLNFVALTYGNFQRNFHNLIALWRQTIGFLPDERYEILASLAGIATG